MRAEHHFHFIDESGFRCRLAAIMQMIIGLHFAQAIAHRQQRRDADAARDQQMLFRCRFDREIVLRASDLEHVADLDVVVHVDRAALAARFAQDRGNVAAALGRIVRQRIGVVQAVRQFEHQMRARFPTRQRVIVRRGEDEFLDARRELSDLDDHKLKRRHLMTLWLQGAVTYT